MMESGSEETRRLRLGMRDLAAISALPSVWANFGPTRVADSLAGALVHMLGLRFVYVNLRGSAGSRIMRSFTRQKGWPVPTECEK